MIDNPLLYLLVERLNALRHRGVSSEESDLEHQYLDRQMAARAPGEMEWRDHALNAYVRLARSDLADIPARTHHWFVEQIEVHGGLQDARDGFVADLYDLLDPVGRFMIVRALARSERIGWNALDYLASRLSEMQDAIRERRTTEFAEVLLDVWLSERSPFRVRDGREDADRPVPEWFERAIRTAQGSGGAGELVSDSVRRRADTLDPRTAEILRRLAGGAP